MSYIIRASGALLLSWLVGFALSMVACNFTFISYVCMGEIFQDIFSFSVSEVMRGIAVNQVLPGLGILSTIESPRWAMLLLIIAATIALTIIGFIFMGVMKLVDGNKVMAVLCSLVLLWQFYICIRITYVHPYVELTFCFCVLSGIILLINLALIITGACMLYTGDEL